MSALGALSRYVRRPETANVCELCGGSYPDEHDHAVDIEERRIVCVCRACALAFRGTVENRFRAVPRDVRREQAFSAAEAWNELGIPVGVAFCFYASRAQRWLAVLPGPAGATEAELDEARWQKVHAASSLARSLEPDVEALLVRVRPGHPPEAFAAPIDRCYELAAILRRTWRGFDGGDEARGEIETYFARLAQASRVVSP